MTTDNEPDDYLDSWDEQVPPSAAERALQQRLAEQQKRHAQDEPDLTDDFLAEFAQANLDPVEHT